MIEEAGEMKMDPNLANTSVHNSTNELTSIQDVDSDIEDMLNEVQEMHQSEETSNDSMMNDNSIKENCKTELEVYKQINVLSLTRNDENGKKCYSCPLKHFWSIRNEQFPILSRVATKYLCIPATSAPSERVFSIASKIVNKFRNRINPSNAGTILFVNANLKWYNEQHKKDNEQCE